MDVDSHSVLAHDVSLNQQDQDIDKLEIQRKLISEVFVEPLKTYLIAKDILSSLHNRGVTCIRSVSSRIRRLNSLGQHGDACQLLVDTLCESEEGNWYQALVESLEDAKYQLLAALLKDEEVPHKDYTCLLNQLMLFKSDIEEEVRLEHILLRCLAKDLINHQHREEVVCEERNAGNTSAVSLLLHYIYRLKKTWFKDFIVVLVEANYRELADHVAGKDQVQEWVGAVDAEDGLCESRDTSLDGSTMEHQLEHVEPSCSQIQLMAGNDPASTEASSTVSVNEGECQDATNFQGACSDPHNDVNMCKPADSLTLVKNASFQKNIDFGDASLPGRSHDGMSMVSVEDNFLARPNVDGVHVDHLAVTSRSTQEELQEIQLRGYQMELAEKGLQGKNVIVCAPTGSGKTHVALYICKNHLDENMEAKVIFFCNQVALVDQQSKAFRRYIDRKVIALTGDKDDLPPLVYFLEEYDVVVMTPQILLDNFSRKDMKSLFDSGITLMVFDECHHTKKKHQYNRIMGLYLDEKFDKGSSHAPQIVGLTASLGVGKANDINQAMDHIVRLCANLDCDDICTVKNQANTDELKRHVSVPYQEVCQSAGRPSSDRFVVEMQAIMIKIEHHIKEAGDEMVQHVPKLGGLLNGPTEKGNERYTQWATELRNNVFTLSEHRLRKRALVCIGAMQSYNEALIIAHNCRAKDALDFLEKKFAEMPSAQQFDETVHWLDTLYKERKDFLEELAQQDENPKLTALMMKILEAYRENPESHGIIFVKTRALCTSLVSWMEDSEELRHLKPAKVTGAIASDNGMTQRQQVNVLNYFKDGKHKIIIATSVAEEGLDIRSCNLVIRYQHVTNEIAMVQARGRARAEDSQYLVMAEAGSGVGQKESINIIREAMMHKALDEVSKIPQQELKAKKENFQLETKADREIDAKISRSIQAANGNKVYQFRCGQCHMFVCMSTDFRTLYDSHHTVPDEEIMQRIRLVDHPRPQKYGEINKIGKMYCKECSQDWGIQIRYKQLLLPVLKITSFALLDDIDEPLSHIRRWKDAPFSVPPFSPEDLQKKVAESVTVLYEQ